MAACAPPGDDEPLATSSESDGDDVEQGDAELVGTRKGSALGSARANPNASYFPSRSIATLDAVGALDDGTRAALRRADGVLAAYPADGLVSLEELVRLEAPEFDRVLLPSERAGLARAWKLMEAPKNAPPAYLAPVGSFEPVKRVVREAGKIDTKESVPLARVSPDPALARLQLAFDQDGKKATIAMADIDGALAAPAPFTPTELDAFRAARGIIARQLLAPGTARLEVEAPAEESKVLGTIAAVKLRHVRSTSYVEERTATDAGLRGYSFTARRESAVRFEGLPVDMKLVVVRILGEPGRPGASVSDVVAPATPAYEAGTGYAIANATTWSGEAAVVELWRGGKRRSAVSLAALQEAAAVSLDAFTDFDVVASGKPLAKNAVGIDRSRGAVRFAYAAVTSPPRGGVTGEDVARVATKPLDLAVLPLGEYTETSFTGATQTLEVVTDKVIFYKTTPGRAATWPPPSDDRLRPGTFVWNAAWAPVFENGKIAVMVGNPYLLRADGSLYAPLRRLDGATRSAK